MKRFGLVVLAILGSIAFPALAQTAIQPGSIVGTFNVQGYIPASPFYTVPGDRAARVTDIMVSNYHVTDTCYGGIGFGNGVALYFILGPLKNERFSLNTGYGLTPGQYIYLSYTGGTCTSTYVHIRGFHFTIP